MLSERLGLSPGELCCLVGGGGKTSSLYALAAENTWGRTLSTTTTMMRDPRREDHPFQAVRIGCGPPQEEGPGAFPLFAASRAVPPSPGKALHKVKGFSPDELFPLLQAAAPSLTVVEADGAACRSIKMPRPGEPVLPASTTALIGVVGLDILGRPASDETVHRFSLFREKLGFSEGTPLGWEQIQGVVNHPEGLFKDAPSGARRILLLNKADALSGADGSPREVLSRVRSLCPGPERILLTNLADYRNPIILDHTN